MAVWRVLFPVLVIVGVCASPIKETLSPFATAAIISSNGYPSETHHVTTSDGYILEMHRIPHGKNQSPSANRPVVFLMHGLTAASNSFIVLGPEHGPAYNLADAGFDIWMGNARGNRNSRYHVSLNPDNARDKHEFFDFSFEEIGVIDLPAMIDYVLEYTGKEKLHYIGHSQGGTTFLVMNSMKPEYNDKIASAHLFAGVGYMNYFPNEELISFAALTDVIYNMAVLTGFVELYPPSSDEVPVEQRVNYCTGDVQYSYMCELVGARHLRGSDISLDSINDMFNNQESAGAALKQIAHYGQNIRDKSFRRWSYGSIRNLLVYGSRNPPVYDLSLITINVTMHYTVNDNLLDERDVIAMASDMPNTSVRKVARDSFLHEDFVVAFDAKDLVTDYVIEALYRDSGISASENIVEVSEEVMEHEEDDKNDLDIEMSEENKEYEEDSENDLEIEALPITVGEVIESPATDSAYSFVLNNTLQTTLTLLGFILFMK